MYVGEAFEQGLFPNFEEMTMAEFAQAVIMVLMGRAAGRIIQPRGGAQKPEDPKGPKPEPTEPLRLENGEPVLRLMENSTHPDVLAANAIKAQRNMDQANAKFVKTQETPLKLMENSTHPDVLSTKLDSLKKQYKTLKESGRE